MPVARVTAAIVAAVAAGGMSVMLTSPGAAAPAGTDAFEASPRGDPGAFVTRIVGYVVKDDYTHAWNYLYPAHQRVAPRHKYVACELQSPLGWILRSVEVLGVADRRLRIPGQTKRVAGKVVTLRIAYEDPALQTEGAFVQSFRAVPAGSRWAWILTPERYALYRADAC